MWVPGQGRAVLGAALLSGFVFVAMRIPDKKESSGGAISRREAAKALVEARGESPAGGCKEPFFKDVPCADAGWGWIEKLRTDRLTSGCDPSGPRFCPDDPLNRAQTAMMVARAMAGSDAAVPVSYGPDSSTRRSYSCDPGKPALHFKDAAASEIFGRHVHYLWAKGVLAGEKEDSFNPGGTMTRAEMADFLGKSFKGSKTGKTGR